MDSNLYRAAREGNVEFLKRITTDEDRERLTLQSPLKNNALHIAARFGHELFASEILLRGLHSLLCQQNSKGDTPLHVAAGAGHFILVKHLTASYQPPRIEATTELESSRDVIRELENGEDVKSPQLWRIRNWENNTAFHEALKNGHEEVAGHLLGLDPGLACFVNDAGESPLYLAAVSGLHCVLGNILRQGSSFSLDGPNGQNPLHAGVIGRKFRIVQYLVGERPDLIKQADNDGKTALHLATESNCLKTSILLLEKDTSPAYMANNKGLTPLLTAASSGSTRMIQAILNACPDSIELLDWHGRNALHLAVKNNTLGTVKRLLKMPEMKQLINEPDKQGNTPLHLATENHHYLMVTSLMANKCDLNAKNKDGLTALDFCESHWELSYQQRFIWRYLKKHKASRGGHCHLGKLPPKLRTVLYAHPKADLKQMANTLSVVAALLATVTFAAAFTMPGGYSNDGPNVGVVVLVRKAALKVFVLSDTIAICSSMTVVFVLIWAMVGDPAYLICAVRRSMRLLISALIGTMVAFVTGLYVVISPESLWLAILVCIMGSSVPLVVYKLRYSSSIRTPYILRLQKGNTLPRNRKTMSHN